MFEIETEVSCTSNNISTPKRLFCNNNDDKYYISILPRQQNRADFFSTEESSRSICDAHLIQNWRESCVLMHTSDFVNADDWFEKCFILLIYGASVCIIDKDFCFILIRLLAIAFVAYLFLCPRDRNI